MTDLVLCEEMRVSWPELQAMPQRVVDAFLLMQDAKARAYRAFRKGQG